MSEGNKQYGVVITPEIQQLIATAVSAAVEAAKKPYVSDEEKKRIENAQQDRRDTALLVKQEMENRIAAQNICSHEHRDGNTHCVYVVNGNFVLCQKCQKVIRPETEPDLFNRVFQKTQNAGVFD